MHFAGGGGVAELPLLKRFGAPTGVGLLRIGGGHRWRRELFIQGIRHGYLHVEDVEDTLPDGLLTASEKWLLYFSLRAMGVQLRDATGAVLTPDEIVPEHHRPPLHNGVRRVRTYSIGYGDSVSRDGVDVDHLA